MNMKPLDPVDEIRAIRARISMRYDNDPRKLGEYYQELQKQYVGRLVLRTVSSESAIEKPETS